MASFLVISSEFQLFLLVIVALCGQTGVHWSRVEDLQQEDSVGRDSKERWTVGLCEGGFYVKMMQFLAVMGVESVMEDVADDLKPLNLWCCSL